MSADANRIDPMADTILNRAVPEHRRSTRHSARQVLYILRTDFAKKFFYSDGCLSFFNETVLGGYFSLAVTFNSGVLLPYFRLSALD